MRWLKPCEDTLKSDERSRMTDCHDHYRRFEVDGWEEKKGLDKELSRNKILLLNSCRYCEECIKTPQAPDDFYGSDVLASAWNKVKCPREEPYSCGMAADSMQFPLLNMNWRVPGPLCPLAVEYRKSVTVDFSLTNLQYVATLGNRIVRECGDVRLAARRVQEIEMRSLEPQVRSTAALLQNHPALRDRIAELHTIGALPFFRGRAPDNPRPSGLPYD